MTPTPNHPQPTPVQVLERALELEGLTYWLQGVATLGCFTQFGSDVVREAVKALAAQQHELERLRAQGQWIPVSERLPEEGMRVFITGKEVDSLGVWRYTHIATLTHGHIWSDQGDQFTGVTHWQPLPTPPAAAQAEAE